MDKDSVIRSSRIVSLGTAASRFLGLVREMLMADFFGTSLASSAFKLAFTIPNLFRRLFGEGALAAAFIPVFTEALEKEGKEEAWRFATKMMSLVTAILAAIVVVGIVGVSVALRYVEEGGRTWIVLSLLRVMLPYMLFICLVAFSMAILNSFGHFVLPAFTPVLLNVVWITTLVTVCYRFGTTLVERVHLLAMGIVIAGILQLGIQYPMLARYGFRLRSAVSWRDERVRRVLLLMGPAALGMGVFQINVMIDRLIAYVVADWATSALAYSEYLIYLPMGLFATAMGTVLLPALSRHAARHDYDEMKTILGSAARDLMFMTIPAAVGLFVLARPVVELIFERGNFDAQSSVQTTRALVFYAPGLVVFSLYKVVVPGFYAMKDTLTPLRTGLVALVLNIVLNVTFVVTWPYEYKHSGLALATVISSGVNVTILSVLLHRRLRFGGFMGMARCMARIALAAVAMGYVVLVLHSRLETLVVSRGMGLQPGRVVSVLGSIAGGIIVYGILAALLCRPELKASLAALRSRR